MSLYNYPFGSPMPSRSFSASSYRYGFNGKEKDDEVNVNGGEYDFGARMYDGRLGRWWSVDPLTSIYFSHSPYNFVLNNPITFIDPDGMKVKLHREEGVSRKEFRAFKKTLKDMRNNSESFKTMYQDLKKSDHVYVFNATSSTTGGDNKEVNGQTMINVGLKANFGDPVQLHSTVGHIAHEVGHAWLAEQGFPVSFPQIPGTSILGSKVEAITKMNDWIEKVTGIKNNSELDAMHIENIVRTELGRSTFSAFSGIGLGATYQGGFGIKMTLTTEGYIKKSTTFINLDALKDPHTAQYYNSTKSFNIYKEFNTKPK